MSMETIERPAKRTRTGRLQAALLAPIIPILGILLWFFALQDSTNSHYPTVEGVIESIPGLVTERGLFTSLGISLARVLVGFVVAVVVGTVVGALVGRFRVIAEALTPIIEVFRPIAPIAWVPLAVLWLGTGNAAPIAIIAYAAFFPVVLNVTAAARDVDSNLINVARSFGSGKVIVQTRVVLPAIVPGILVGARLGMGLGWAAVVAAELAAGVGNSGSTGIGTLMLSLYSFSSDPNGIVVCMICVGILGVLLDMVLRKLGAMVTRGR